MPVTKKKGAIFSIYADSPSQPSTSASTSTRPPPVRTYASSSCSPTKRSALRKALSSVQPKTVKGFPTSSTTKADKAKDGTTSDPKPSAPSVNAKPRLSSAASRPVLAPPPPRTAPSKRQIEIFSSPTIPSSPPLPAASRPDPSTATRSHARPSPSKRSRVTPVKQRTGKENQPHSSVPISDSPASRTRSKARADSLVGDGRGALSFRKGRGIVILLAEDEGGPSSLSVTLSPSRRKGKGLTVRADGPLVDVSEAYGASGVEPEGFRDVPR